MGEILTLSQSSLLQGSRHQLGTSRQLQLHVDCRQVLSVGAPSFAPIRLKKIRLIVSLYWEDKARFFRDSKMPTTFPVVSAGTGSDILLDSSGSKDNFSGGNGDGGGGSGSGGNNNNDKGGPDENDGHDSGGAKKVGMSMSQKLTLGYAALVGVGGAMGYIKGGSMKSLISGGLSALVLYTVYSVLPTKPVLASCLGLGLSLSLLVVMGSRFKRSGKIFPAGVVSFVSLVMSGGYLHGIFHSSLLSREKKKRSRFERIHRKNLNEVPRSSVCTNMLSVVVSNYTFIRQSVFLVCDLVACRPEYRYKNFTFFAFRSDFAKSDRVLL